MSVTSNPLALPADWSWQVGKRLLDGARLCSFDTRTVVVLDDDEPLALCDNQLAVSVREGLIHPDDDACCYQTVGNALLTLDFCRILPDLHDDVSGAQVTANAQKLAKARGGILQGLQKLLGGYYGEGDDAFATWLVDPIQLGCSNVDIGQWSKIAEENQYVRWGLPLVIRL